MALNAPRCWLIAYDIADPRRLGRLHRFIKKHAVPVQYSVFYFEGSAAQLGRLLQQIETRIHPGQDDVRAYQLPEAAELFTLGKGSLPRPGLITSSIYPALDKLLRPAMA